MKILLLSLILSSLSYANNLELSVSNVVSPLGQMAIAIYKNGEGYPKHAEKAIYREFIPMNKLPIKIQLEPGNYGIAIFQDLNKDRKLNTKAFGIPKEPFGFSNNPTLFMGAPRYKKVKFDIRENAPKKINIELKYY